MTEQASPPMKYDDLITDIKQRIRVAQMRAMLAFCRAYAGVESVPLAVALFSSRASLRLPNLNVEGQE